jgi:hypothetical protein
VAVVSGAGCLAAIFLIVGGLYSRRYGRYFPVASVHPRLASPGAVRETTKPPPFRRAKHRIGATIVNSSRCGIGLGDEASDLSQGASELTDIRKPNLNCENL